MFVGVPGGERAKELNRRPFPLSPPAPSPATPPPKPYYEAIAAGCLSAPKSTSYPPHDSRTSNRLTLLPVGFCRKGKGRASPSWLDQRADVWELLSEEKTVVSATIGSLTSTWLGYPLDSLKSRMQTARGCVLP